MTKLREPVTLENTLFLVLGRLTIERAAEVVGCSTHHLRALSDPDKRERLTIDDAIKLDLAHRADAGEGYPLFETYGRLLDAASAERFADADALGRLTVKVAREAGEATAALVAATRPNATVQDLEHALRELEGSDEVTDAAIAHVREMIRRARDGPPTP